MDSLAQDAIPGDEDARETAGTPELENTSADDTQDGFSREKANDILAACGSRDLSRLRSLADSSGGFLTDALRRSAWPILLGLPHPPTHDDTANEKTPASGAAAGDWKDLPRHEDEDQVDLDVKRSFIYYPNNQSDAELDQRKAELSSLITEVLRRYPYLCYFQGYHDICQVFLLVLGPEARAPTVARLSALRIRDFMLPSLAPTTAQLRLLPDILDRADPKLRRHLTGVEPFYALPGTLTMYAHNIEKYHDIARLFDVFLAREPVFSIYVFAQIVLDRRAEIFEIDEPDMMHVVLGKVPPTLDLDTLIADAISLFARYPPETLRAWRQISAASALKTARDLERCAQQSMEEGHEFFIRQAKELRWMETRDRVLATLWTYRRPARTMGMAIAVGIAALYLRRNPAVVHHVMALFSR